LREIVIGISREATMPSVYECGSVIPGCRFVAHGERRDDVVVIAIEHLHRVHEIGHISDPLRARIRAVIKEVPVPSEAP
jgi:predicted small metal-binding protein